MSQPNCQCCSSQGLTVTDETAACTKAVHFETPCTDVYKSTCAPGYWERYFDLRTMFISRGCHKVGNMKEIGKGMVSHNFPII